MSPSAAGWASICRATRCEPWPSWASPTQALASGVPVRRREYRNGRGRLLFAVDDDRFWRDVGRPVCVRHGDLLDALALPDGGHARARAGRRPPDPHPTGVEVELEGAPSPRHFDFVIGADGVHSAMREAVADDGLRPSSMTGSSWRFVADNPGVDCWTAWSGRDATFLLIPVEEGRVYGYAARTRGGDTGRRPVLVGARGRKASPRSVGAAVAQALEGGELHHAAVDEVRLERWHHGRLVLIGDAAHATGPVWAQGVAMALEDALVLGELLASTPAERLDRRRGRVRTAQAPPGRARPGGDRQDVAVGRAAGLAARRCRTRPRPAQLSGGLRAAARSRDFLKADP